jgi:GT2 family glycosyltransferase
MRLPAGRAGAPPGRRWPRPEGSGSLPSAAVTGPQPTSAPASPRVDVVILTRGDRADALARAIASVRAQRGVETGVLVVWNGVPVPPTADPDARHLSTEENLGIPAGRNLGAAAVTAPLVLFLDDDAALQRDDLLATAAARFAADARLAVISPRIVDEHGDTAQRHVPRVGRRGVDRGGPVALFLGGVAIVRRAAFEEVGGFAGELFYAMEETDLAWRLADRGWSIVYAPELAVFHPRTDPTRHPDAIRRTARNRVWVVHRSLPAPLAVGHLLVWLGIEALRRPRELPTFVSGYRLGWRTRIGPRRPIRWATVARLTRLGRPPIV